MKKRRRRIASLLLFCFSLAIGIWLGIQIIPKSQSTPSTETQFSQDQQSLLVIGVDRADAADARLQGVWYVTYLNDSPHITLIPIYPDPNGNSRKKGQNLVDAFRIRQDGMVDPDFLKAIKQDQNLTWNTYVLVDDIAMMEVVDFFGGVLVDGEAINGPLAIGGIPRAWEKPREAILGQASLLDNLCERISFDSTPKNYQRIMALLPGHMRSEMSVDAAFQDWLKLISTSGTLNCEFPSLTTPESSD
jgi:hypothetical protein